VSAVLPGHAAVKRVRISIPVILGIVGALASCSRDEPPAANSRPHVSPTAQASSATLSGTSWRLVEFQSSDDTTRRPDDPSKYTLTFGADGELSVRIDCNVGRGTWQTSGPRLELGPLTITHAACPAGSLHDQIVRQWPYIRSYVLRDGRLFLALMADGGIYEFEPVASTRGAPPAGGPTAAAVALPETSGRAARTPWTNTVWRVASAGRAPSSVYVFLEDGTLVMTSCVETYRLAEWEMMPNGRLLVTEDRVTTYEASVTEETSGVLRLQLFLKTETVDLMLAKAGTPFVCPDLPR
jgi:heat shock protein HslJ